MKSNVEDKMGRQSPIIKTINQVAREYAREQKRLKAQEEKAKREKEKEFKRLQKENEIKIKEDCIKIANQITQKSQNQREEILSLLKNINNNRETINWELLKNHSNYNITFLAFTDFIQIFKKFCFFCI